MFPSSNAVLVRVHEICLNSFSEPVNELFNASVLRRRQLRETEEVEEEMQAEEQRLREPVLRSADEASEKELQVSPK